jgi:hypothetical protein
MAPVAISGGATVLVLGRRGYETAVKGTNGFVCKVDRQWQAPFLVEDFWNPSVRAPVCLNPQAVRSVLPVNQRRTELALAGVSKADMEVRMKSAFDKKEFGPPEPGAMSYMMSKGQRLDAGNEPPHVMFYVPGAVVDADWGANTSKSPIVGGGAPGDAREPQITFVVMVTHWSDGTPVTATAHHEQK